MGLRLVLQYICHDSQKYAVVHMQARCDHQALPRALDSLAVGGHPMFQTWHSDSTGSNTCTLGREKPYHC